MKIKRFVILHIMFIFSISAFAKNSWEMVKVSNIEKGISQLLFINDSTGWVTYNTPGIIYRTDDGGKTWTEQQFNLKSVTIYRVSFIDRNHGWALGSTKDAIGSYGLILQTDDGGKSWKIKAHLKHKEYLLNIVVFNDMRGIAVGRKGKGAPQGIIYNKENKDEYWTEHVQNFPAVILDDIKFADERNGWIISSSELVLKTNDGGKSWVPIKIPDRPHFIRLCVVDSDTVWFIGGRALIYFTSDGGNTWSKANIPSDSENIFFSDIAFADSRNGWICGEKGVLLVTKDGGRSWEKEEAFTNDVLERISLTRSKIYVVGTYGKIFMRSRE